MNDFEKMENKFLEKWFADNNGSSFLKDGVIDAQTYFNEDTKVLFVLKEANWPNGQDDMKKYLKDPKLTGNWWKTWNNVARWTLALLNGSEYPKYISGEQRAAILSRIAFINLKKEGGGAQADSEKIADAAKKDSEYIKRQIEMYSPDIIICCGQRGESNASILRDYVLLNNVSEWKKLENNVFYYYFNGAHNKQIPVVSFVHPQMWGGHKKFEEKYNLMLGIRNGLLKNNL